MSEKTVGDAPEAQLAALLRNLEAQSRSAALFLEKSAQQVDRLSELVVRLQAEFEGGAEERSEASRKRAEVRPSTARRADEPVKASRSFVHNGDERRANLTPPPAISSAKKGCAPPDSKAQPAARTADSARNMKASCVVRDPKKETAMRDSKLMTISRPSVHERLAKTPKDKAKTKPETAPPKPKVKEAAKPRISAALPKAVKALSEEMVQPVSAPAPVPEASAAEEEPSADASLREEGRFSAKEAGQTENVGQNVEVLQLNPSLTKKSTAVAADTLVSAQQEQTLASPEKMSLAEKHGDLEEPLLTQHSDPAALPREPADDRGEHADAPEADQPTAVSLTEEKSAVPGAVVGEVEPLFDISVSAVLPPEPTNLPGMHLLSSALLGESTKGVSEELKLEQMQPDSPLSTAAPSEEAQQSNSQPPTAEPEPSDQANPSAAPGAPSS